MLMLGVLAVAVVVGLARGGNLLKLGEHPWRRPALPIAAVLLQIVGFLPDESAPGTGRTFAAALHVLSYALALTFIWVNRRTPWLPLMGAGLLANAAVILANGGFVPVLSEIVVRTPIAEVAVQGHYNNSVLMNPGTPLWFLGDVFLTPPVLGMRWAVSVGDLLIAIATFALIQRLTGTTGAPRGRAAG